MSLPRVQGPTALASAPAPVGRLGVMTAFAAAACAIPIPLVPDRVIARVRGALVHDVVSRHGMSLTGDAREILAGADPAASRALARKAAEALTWVILKRLGPMAGVQSVVRGVEVFALGHLLERYLTSVRPSAGVRIQAEEARRVRQAINRAVQRALSPTLAPTPATMQEGAEDLRDELTRSIDRVLLMGASLPSYVERRLDAAFDEVLAQMPELGRV